MENWLRYELKVDYYLNLWLSFSSKQQLYLNRNLSPTSWDLRTVIDSNLYLNLRVLAVVLLLIFWHLDLENKTRTASSWIWILWMRKMMNAKCKDVLSLFITEKMLFTSFIESFIQFLCQLHLCFFIHIEEKD